MAQRAEARARLGGKRRVRCGSAAAAVSRRGDARPRAKHLMGTDASTRFVMPFRSYAVVTPAKVWTVDGWIRHHRGTDLHDDGAHRTLVVYTGTVTVWTTTPTVLTGTVNSRLDRPRFVA